MMLTEPLRYETVKARLVNSYGRFHVIRVGLRYHIREQGSDELCRWVGPTPMWSRMQTERIAQALFIAWNAAWDDGKRYGQEIRAIGLRASPPPLSSATWTGA